MRSPTGEAWVKDCSELSMSTPPGPDEDSEGFVEIAPRLAHEAMNLACGLRGVEELLREASPDEAMARVSSLAQRIERLGRHLSQYAKASLIGLVEVDLPSLVADATAAIRPLAAERDVAIHARASHDRHRAVGDHERLLLALSTLLRHVVARTRAGGVVEVVQYSAHLDGGDGAAFAIATTRTASAAAPPISFRPFVARLSGETGLELAIAQRVARAHGGAVTAVDGDQGLVLTLIIPAVSISSEWGTRG
jgi:signal transduction histidine kinase